MKEIDKTKVYYLGDLSDEQLKEVYNYSNYYLSFSRFKDNAVRCKLMFLFYEEWLFSLWHEENNINAKTLFEQDNNQRVIEINSRLQELNNEIIILNNELIKLKQINK